MGAHDAIKSLYLGVCQHVANNRLHDYRWFVEQEIDTWKNWVDIPIGQRLQLWRHGFTSPCAELYDLDERQANVYLSELQRYRLFKSANGAHRYLLDDKLSQHWMLSGQPEYRPTAYGLIDRGHVHGVASTALDRRPVPVSEWLPEALRTHSKLVLKHLRGLGGHQVIVCEYDDGFHLDGERMSETALCESVSELSGYLVTAHVHQHSYAAALYPEAANTIRALTIWDGERNELIVPIVIQRIGTERSRPVDNFSQGGLTAEIDTRTGTIGRAAQKPFSGRVRWFSSHPDTGAAIEGETVPNWQNVLSTVRRLAKENTHTPVIGWDILLDETGTPVVLEANTGTDVSLFQIHRPLLTDQRVDEFVSRHLD
jgi:hypothetical protein